MNLDYPKINVGVTRGYPAVMAFIFTKDGTKVYFGSYDKIRDWFSTGDLCHGIVLNYHRGRIFNRKWMLFGYGSEIGSYREYFTLERTNARKWKIGRTERLVPAGMTETRNTWYLLKHNGIGGTPIIWGRWRKLPQKYLNQFG